MMLDKMPHPYSRFSREWGGVLRGLPVMEGAWSELRRLEEAYLSIRYFYTSYEKRDAESLLEAASRLISILEDLR